MDLLKQMEDKYCIYKYTSLLDGSIFYIGKSYCGSNSLFRNLQSRISNHARDERFIDKKDYKIELAFCSSEKDMSIVESVLISKYKPELNTKDKDLSLEHVSVVNLDWIDYEDVKTQETLRAKKEKEDGQKKRNEMKRIIDFATFYEENDRPFPNVLAKHFGVCETTAIKILKQGDQLGYCKYDPKTSLKKNSQKISEICRKKVIAKDIDNNEEQIFDSVSDCAFHFNTSSSQIVNFIKLKKIFSNHYFKYAA